jgi:hypothetical protein
MPIRVTCQCGQSLNVPDAMAGKSGKCPKCQQMIKVPTAAASPSATGGSIAAQAKSKQENTVAKQPQGTSAIPQSAATNTMASLLDQAGLVQKTGQFCPNCDQPSRPGAVLCTTCGFSFTEGTKVEGHKVVQTRKFGNKNLNEAAEMMVREESTQKRMLGSGAPWWIMFASLLGLLIFVGGALVKMDKTQTGTVSTIPMLAKIQNANWLPVMAVSAGTGLLLVATFAQLAILFTAFFESTKQGLLCFLPLYIYYYMFSRIRSQRLLKTVLILFVTSILGGLMMGYALPKI